MSVGRRFLAVWMLLCSSLFAQQVISSTSAGMKCDGTTDDTSRFVATMGTLSVSGGTLTISVGKCVLGSNPTAFTIPSNVTIDFTQQGALQVQTGTTLTYNGWVVDNDLHQIFYGSGTVTTTGIQNCNTYPQWTGGTGIASIGNSACGLSTAPVFSTAVTGTSMSSSGNAVVVGPVTLTTPSANGTYRFTIELIQTTAGSGGTCTVGTLSVSLGWKDPDTGATYALSNSTGNIGVTSLNAVAITNVAAMNSGANGVANNFTSSPRDFRAASGTAIQYQIFMGTGSNCTTPPVFAVRPALYYMGY